MPKSTLVVISILFLSSVQGFSQTVNDIPLKEIDVKYIEIVGTSKLMSNKVNIQIDFGQENKYWTSKDTVLKDEDGKLMTLNSMIDALNFLGTHGYEFVSAYAVTIGNQNVYHYLLKKVN